METTKSTVSKPFRHLVKGLVGASFIFSASSTAELIDFDSYTYDSESNLSWLDTSQTKANSYNDIERQFGQGGLFDGWRFAKSTEVDELIRGHVGFTPGDYFSPGTYSPLRSLVELLGVTWGGFADTGNEYGFIYAYVESTESADLVNNNEALVRQIGFKEEPRGSVLSSDWGGYVRPDSNQYFNRDRDSASGDFAAFLVKEGADDPLPEWLVEPDPQAPVNTPPSSSSNALNISGPNQPTSIAAQPAAVSEPGTWSLFALMMGGLAIRRARKPKKF